MLELLDHASSEQLASGESRPPAHRTFLVPLGTLASPGLRRVGVDRDAIDRPCPLARGPHHCLRISDETLVDPVATRLHRHRLDRSHDCGFARERGLDRGEFWLAAVDAGRELLEPVVFRGSVRSIGGLDVGLVSSARESYIGPLAWAVTFPAVTSTILPLVVDRQTGSAQDEGPERGGSRRREARSANGKPRAPLAPFLPRSETTEFSKTRAVATRSSHRLRHLARGADA